MPLDVGNAEQLSESLREVMRTLWVSKDKARAPGLLG